MPATPRYISDLAGTLRSLFRIGSNKLSSSGGTLTVRNQADSADAPIAVSQAKLNGATSGTATLQAAGTTTTYTIILPAAQGAINQTVRNDGAGNLTWVNFETALNAVKAESTSIAFGDGNKNVVALDVGNTVQRVIIDVETAFTTTGVAPAMTIGYATDTSRYVGTNEVDLATQAKYEVSPMDELAGAKTIVVYYTPNDANAGAATVTVEWSLPDTVAP